MRAHPERRGSSGGYERRDTLASLIMGAANLAAPAVAARLLGPLTPGKGRYARILVSAAAGAAVLTTVVDRLAGSEGEDGDPFRAIAHRAAAVGGVAAVGAGGAAITSMWASWFKPKQMWKEGRGRDLGEGPLAVLVTVLAWDFIYYWNHRFMHESRFMWAIHVVHHSSERYNLSTALRQPVADALGTFFPTACCAAWASDRS